MGVAPLWEIGVEVAAGRWFAPDGFCLDGVGDDFATGEARCTSIEMGRLGVTDG